MKRESYYHLPIYVRLADVVELRRKNYTNPDCSFNPDWREIGGSGAMGAATGAELMDQYLEWKKRVAERRQENY